MTNDPRPDPPDFDDADPDQYVEVGGQIGKVSVSLRLFGDDIDPDEVTSLLGCEPTRALRKGAVDPFGKYRRVAPTGSWLLESNRPTDEDLEAQVLFLLGRVSSDEAVWRTLTDRFVVDVFCGVFLDDWNQGFALSPLVLTQLARRNLKIDFDIYSNPDDP
jgi:hypothetical protein